MTGVARNFRYYGGCVIAEWMMTSLAADIPGQIMRRPGSECVSKSTGYVIALVGRQRVTIQPYTEASVIMAAGAVNVGVPNMLKCTRTGAWFMAVGAGCGRTMGSVTLSTGPICVDAGLLLFLYNLESMSPFMTMLAQLHNRFRVFIMAQRRIPESYGRVVRFTGRYVADVTADVVPFSLRDVDA